MCHSDSFNKPVPKAIKDSTNSVLYLNPNYYKQSDFKLKLEIAK